MADSSIQSITNAELVELNRRRKEKANRSAAYYGNARIMKLDVVREREQKAATKVQEKETREYNKHEKEKETIYNKEVNYLMRIGPELFAPPKPPTPRKRVRRPQLIVILRVGKRGLHYMEQVEHMEHAGYDMEQMEHMKQAEHAEQYTSRHGRQIKKTYKATT